MKLLCAIHREDSTQQGCNVMRRRQRQRIDDVEAVAMEHQQQGGARVDLLERISRGRSLESEKLV